MESDQVMGPQKEKNTGKATRKKKATPGHQVLPLSMNRRMVAASATVGREQNTILALLEVDISEARRIMQAYFVQNGEKLSFTAYVVRCLAKTVNEFPHFNAFRKGGHLIRLDELTIGVMVERDLAGEMVPEPFGIRAAQAKTYLQIHEEIRAAQVKGGDGLGSLSGMTWIRFIPSFLFRLFIRIASQNIRIRELNGTMSITSVGMFAQKNQAAWGVPIFGGSTVGIAIGGIVDRPVGRDGQIEMHEHVCLTVAFDHDIVDGAPAARFTKRFSELLKAGDLMREEL